MRVHINGELFSECQGVSPSRWNGWDVPIFTTEQKEEIICECERLGWVGESDLHEFLNSWEQVSEGEWVTNGWVWEVVGE